MINTITSLEIVNFKIECARRKNGFTLISLKQLEQIKERLNQLEEENAKLKQAIEILKDKFYLRVHSNMFGSWLFIKEKTKHGEDVSCELDLDIVDTIKEVIGNENIR